MSGFDFDALRDPLPPEPGARERAAVDARARKLRARSRLNRLAVSSVSVVAVVALVFGIVASQRNNDGGRLNVQGGGGTSTTLPAPTTTTTTLPVVTHSAPAISATFVSANQGWVLQTTGNVAETTDGGHTWTSAGSLGRAAGGYKIRFADAAHGFAFDGGSQAGNAVLATSDGGRTWHALAPPFSNPDDLAVSRGVVYAVAFDGSGQPAWRIWSSPVGDALHWTEDPLMIAPGAGPIASFQFVFSGDAGWLLFVDRVVISGARLTSTGQWGPWGTYPCANAGGAAYLTASSPNDLVASCQEGAYTGPRITSGIYFSHDGGQTFTRQDAPQAGLVASPNGDTAIVPGSAGMERTTDDGATWHGVFDYGGSATDLGFTTATQGFVVFDNTTMLMTHDAGATWQKVTL